MCRSIIIYLAFILNVSLAFASPQESVQNDHQNPENFISFNPTLAVDAFSSETPQRVIGGGGGEDGFEIGGGTEDPNNFNDPIPVEDSSVTLTLLVLFYIYHIYKTKRK